MEGTWDAVMGTDWDHSESKFTVTYTFDRSHLWLVGKFAGEAFGKRFEATSMDSYDALYRAYVNIWTDSMSGTPRISRGTYDPKKKVATLAWGEGQGAVVTTRKTKDKDTMVVEISGPSGGGFGSSSVTSTLKLRH
jgi:hypothetical protein